MKRILKEYFSFSKKERRALLSLLLLMLLFILAPYFYPQKKTVPAASPELLDLLARQQAKDSFLTGAPVLQATTGMANPLPAKLFLFDPNTLDERGWLSLGVNGRLVHTLLNYRNKGGLFRRPGDIRKIWGMKPVDAARLEPYIRIAAQDHAAGKTAGYMQPAKKAIPAALHINTATREDWEALPGIGPVLAKRILAFKEKLGGFTGIDQLARTYGLHDSVFQQIRPMLILDSVSLSHRYGRLQVNSATATEMVNRLWIPFAMAKAIVIYRNAYGKFRSATDLKQIVILPDSVYQRIVPLLLFE